MPIKKRPRKSGPSQAPRSGVHLNGIQVHGEASDGASSATVGGTSGIGVLDVADALPQGATHMVDVDAIGVHVGQISGRNGEEHSVSVVGILELDGGIGAGTSLLGDGSIKNDQADSLDGTQIEAHILGSGFDLGVVIKEESFPNGISGTSAHFKSLLVEVDEPRRELVPSAIVCQ